jgi:hypothetical protein
MRYLEIINKLIIEHAVAKPGDWDGADLLITSISQFIFQKNWKIVGNVEIDSNDYIIARFDDASIHFVIGRTIDMEDGGQTKPRFAVVFRIDLNDESNIGNALGISNLFSVFSVAVKPALRGQRIAKQMYKWLINTQSMVILGDRTQYFGARRLWAALSRDTDLVVDIVDVRDMKIVEQNVTLHHGQYDHEFDQRIWSYGQEIAHIRLVLKNLS